MQPTNIAIDRAITTDRTLIGLTKKTIQNNLILFVIIHRTLEKQQIEKYYNDQF